MSASWWSHEDVGYLRASWPSEPMSTITARLGRTRMAVMSKALDLQLPAKPVIRV